MNDYLLILALAALPAFSNLLGGLVAEIASFSQHTLSLSLHGATGVLLAVIALKLMPTIVETNTPWVTMLTFIVGGVFFIWSDRFFQGVEHRLGISKRQREPWMIFFSMSVHLLSGGLMIGTSATIERNLTFFLAFARFIAHFPQGFAAISEFKQGKVPRKIRLLAAVSFFIPACLGATIGYGLVQDSSLLLKLGILAFTTGILTTAVVEEIIPEAHQKKDSYLSTLTFVVSFALFTLLLIYFK